MPAPRPPGRPRRLGALGTLVWDRIRHPAAAGGAVVEQWGGAAYSLAALSASCPPGWEVVPLVQVGSDLAPQARRFLEQLPNLHLGDGVRTVAEPNNRVELRYQDPATRTERQLGGVPPWRWNDLAPLLRGLDALYLNFISGQELELPTAQRVRHAFAGPVYVDLHSLFLSPPDPSRPRAARPLPEWEQWLGCADIVQLNQHELELLGARDHSTSSLTRLLEHGPRAVAVTLGGAGARYAVRPPLWGRPPAPPSAEVEHATMPIQGGEQPGDPTGCGDVWGSVLFAGLLEGREMRSAVERAHRAAARKVRTPGTAGLRAALADELRG